MKITVSPHAGHLPDGSQAFPGLYSIFVDNWHRGHVWLKGDDHIYTYQPYTDEVATAIADEVERVLGSRLPVAQPPNLAGIADKWDGVLPVLDDEGAFYENCE